MFNSILKLTQEQKTIYIKKFVNEYKIEIDEIKFWTPYPYEKLTLMHRREFSGKEPVSIPFKGRGTPKEIKNYLVKKLKETNETLKTTEEYREFMASINLGVECSGFAYYVLNKYLKIKHNKELKNHLFKSKTQLLKIYDHPNLTSPKGLKRKTVETYPKWVSLAQIQKDWGNNPRYVVDATTFTNEGSTFPIEIKDTQEADIIRVMGRDGIGHPLIVTESKKDKIIYAHSSGRHGRKKYFGGVEYGEIKIIDPKLSIEKQAWKNGLVPKMHIFKPGAIRRLKILSKTGKIDSFVAL